jgi:hypothetical protein
MAGNRSKSARTDAESAPEASSTTDAPVAGAREPPRLVTTTARDSPPLQAAQSYRHAVLSGAEKKFIDFLVDKAIEAWLKR